MSRLGLPSVILQIEHLTPLCALAVQIKELWRLSWTPVEILSQALRQRWGKSSK